MPKISQWISSGAIGAIGSAGAIFTTLENEGNFLAPMPICSALVGTLGALAAWRTLREPKLDQAQIDHIERNSSAGKQAAEEAVRAARAEGTTGRIETRADGEKTRDQIAALQAQNTEMQAKLDRFLAQIAKPDAEPEPERTETKTAAARRAIGDEPEAAEDIAEGRVAQGFAELEAAARAKQGAAAQEWRDIGALAYDVEPKRALRAYRKATQLDGSDFWAWIYLARLEQSHAGDLSAAESAAEAALKKGEDNANKYAAWGEIGEIAIAQGKLGAALEAFTKMSATLQSLADANPNSASAKRDLSVSLSKIGDIAVAGGNLSDARDAYTKSMEIAQALSEADQNSAEAKRDLSVSLSKLGNIAVAEGNLPAARDAFTRSNEVLQALSEADPSSASAKRDLSISLERLGNIAVAEGNLPAARRAYTKQMEIAQALSEADPSSASAKRDLSISLEKRGDVAVKEGNLPAARDAFTKGMEIRQALSEADPSSASTKRDVIVSLAKLAQLTGEVSYWRDALPIVEGMAAKGQLSPADAWMLETIRTNAKGE